MKIKYLAYTLLLGAMSLASCDMNHEPDGSISLEDGMINDADVISARTGLYSSLRGRCGGSYTAIVDLQSDIILGTMQNGNAYSGFTTGNINSNDSDIEGIWAGLYSAIMQTNYFLSASQSYVDSHEVTADFAEDVKLYQSEAHFMRAYYYYMLMNYFCGKYDEATAGNEATGVPIVTYFKPSDDRSSYPGRSTLKETYKLIEDELSMAYTGISNYEKIDDSAIAPASGYLNSYTVLALQARVALLKGDYQVAYDKSKEIIESDLYPLTDIDDYYAMWVNDYGTELIFRPFANADQRGGVPATGGLFNSAIPVQASFVPSAAVIGLLNDNDVRYDVIVTDMETKYRGANIIVPAFNKYPGNPIFNDGNTNAYRNIPKPFRTSEQYLIFAESAYALNKPGDALGALNTLRKARIDGYTDASYSGITLRDQIRQERVLELIGEGFRISDLRRWDLGFTRDGVYSSDYPKMDSYLIQLGLQCYYTPGDTRYTWPIPAGEITSNPQLVGQQNPGY